MSQGGDNHEQYAGLQKCVGGHWFSRRDRHSRRSRYRDRVVRLVVLDLRLIPYLFRPVHLDLHWVAPLLALFLRIVIEQLGNLPVLSCHTVMVAYRSTLNAITAPSEGKCLLLSLYREANADADLPQVPKHECQTGHRLACGNRPECHSPTTTDVCLPEDFLSAQMGTTTGC